MLINYYGRRSGFVTYRFSGISRLRWNNKATMKTRSRISLTGPITFFLVETRWASTSSPDVMFFVSLPVLEANLCFCVWARNHIKRLKFEEVLTVGVAITVLQSSSAVASV